jgi:O-antigen biosynthesis protein
MIFGRRSDDLIWDGQKPIMVLTLAGSSHALIELALTAYQADRLDEAFRAIDRACRLTTPAAEHILLRGVVLSELGLHDEATEAMQEAYRLAPSNPIIRRQLFARQVPLLDQPRLKALALQLAGTDLDPELLELVSPVLGLDDKANVGCLSQQDGSVVLTLAGTAAETMTVPLAFDSGTVVVEIAMDHHVQGSGRFRYRGSASLRWPAGAKIVEVDRPGAETMWFRSSLTNLSWHAAQNAVTRVNGPKAERRLARESDVTVIVPVYGDIQATVRCVVSLLSDRTSQTNWHLVLVNDNSPEPDMDRLVELANRDRRVTTISHRFNLGFIGAINAALQTTTRSDVILLNSDTIVAPGWIDRMRAAALSRPQIGTVTPLTNNGELVSLPEPFVANQMPADSDITLLDRLASEVNAGGIIDLPTGIGFCLYIKRACLDAVGYLDDQSYERGYLEEVDFCQRAAAKGFANVCATDVFVAHIGNASFGAQKSLLVARNGEEVGRRYPVHDAQCRLFMDADPLRMARLRLQHAWLTALTQQVPAAIFVSSARGVDADVATAVSSRLQSAENTNILVLTGRLADEGVLVLHNLSGGFPYSLKVVLAGPLGIGSLTHALGRFSIASLALLDADASLDSLILECLSGDAAISVFITDASLVCPRGDLVMGGTQPCSGSVSALTCADCLRASRPESGHMGEASIASFRGLRAYLLGTAEHVYATLPEATQIMSLAGVERAPILLPPRSRHDDSTPTRPRPRRAVTGSRPCLGILALHETTADFMALLAVMQALDRAILPWDIVVLGETLDDDAVMRSGKVHVTGLMRPDEVPGMLDAFGCSAVFVDMRATRFADPLLDVICRSEMRLIGRDTVGVGGMMRRMPGAIVLPVDIMPEQLAYELNLFMQSVCDGQTDSSKHALEPFVAA